MKASLYALHDGQGWTWHSSIRFDTDVQFWFERYGGEARLLLLEPSFSLGQAEMLRRQLQDRKGADLELTASKFVQDKLQKSVHATAFRLMDFMPSAAGAGLTFDPLVYSEMVEVLRGRLLLFEEGKQLLEERGIGGGAGSEQDWTSYLQLAKLRGDIELTNGFDFQEKRKLPWLKKVLEYTCKRCGSGTEKMHWSDCLFCGQKCPYCEECLTMGRNRFCSMLLRGREKRRNSAASSVSNEADLSGYIAPWGLSEAQSSASSEGLRFLSGHRDPGGAPASFLIWAVTGAGKTEMIYPFIQYAVSAGKKVLIATPRRDVVLELSPRIAGAFPSASVVTLYGGSGQRWEEGDITVATTHQLIRFDRAFDLVVIDEIDAFPFHNNPVLEYAAQKACRTDGSYILLSATPPSHLRKAAARKRLPHAKVPVRYHRHPLPVPEVCASIPLQKMLQTKKIPRPLLEKFEASVRRGAQQFIFVPNIKSVAPFVSLLQRHFSAQKVNGTSSQDPERPEKVQSFRNGDIRMLVTTTILERGVTVPKTDVFILDADSRLFDEAALVQMAGRAGRSKNDPAGKVIFAAKEKTKSQSDAISHIRKMNRLAKRKGYLIDEMGE